MVTRLYAVALRAFPAAHRARFGADMIETFERERAARRRDRGRLASLWFALIASLNVVTAGLEERRRRRLSGQEPGRRPVVAFFARDLIHAIAALTKARGFTFVCVASLGVGMGTVMAILMIVRAIFGPALGVNSRDLVELVVPVEGPLRAKTGGPFMESWSYPDFVAVRDAETDLAVSGWSFADATVALTDGKPAGRVAMMYVSPNYFSTVGVTLDRGLGFSAARLDAPIDRPSVVLAYRFWRDRLAADPGIVGQSISLNRVPHVVVGIAPEVFVGHLSPEGSTDSMLWVPLHHHPRLQGPNTLQFDRNTEWVRVLGRLAPGSNLERANASVVAIMRGVAQRHPDTNQFKSGSVEPYASMGAASAGEVAIAKTVFFGMANVVLFVVCLNISGMMVVRSAMRERELAVRLALGASRSRLIQYILSEAVVLAVLGGVLAAVILYGVPTALFWWYDFWHPDLAYFKPDVWTVAAGVGLCFVTSLVFGLVPAIRFSRPVLVNVLKDDAGGGRRRVSRVHRLTAAIQAGIAVPFLAIGVVKLDQVRTTARAELGFELHGLFGAALNMEGAGPAEGAGAAALANAKRRLLEGSGVTSVTLADGMPLDFRRRNVRISTGHNARPVAVHTTRVDEHYFETLRIPLVSGRGIAATDRAGADSVVVLSQSLAAKLFPNRQPVGERVTLLLSETDEISQRLKFSADAASSEFTVVGVTADHVTSQMGTERPQMFISLAQYPAPLVALIARSSATDAAMLSTYQAAVEDFDAGFTSARLATAEKLIRRSMRDLATHSTMAALAAGIALTLAALGVYGVVGFMVAMRTREIGVRMALGATRALVLRNVLVDAAKVVGPGVAIGLILAVLAVRVGNVPETWYDLGAMEPVIYSVSAGLAIFIALLAGLPPARRAATVDPLRAIRAE